ncbi:hypothetical protein G7Y89_g8143 [Cudoniella acicularis]|uniref:Uncharacterized protein n=1 Tax=Cudoniella acicularis TaxID=354080 RepID=A0A8H4W0V8_9HELO|nr:hypothetical protein G7Y89_g8143 [Cudoniella acicularis]
MTGDEIVQETSQSRQAVAIWARDYSLKETADIPSLQSRHLPENDTEDSSEGGLEDGSEDGLDDELVDDLEEGPDDDMEDGLSNDSGSRPKEDLNISFGSSTHAGNNGTTIPNDSKANFVPDKIRSHWQGARQLTIENQHLFGSILLDEKMRKSILRINIEFWLQKINKAPAPRMVAFRKDGSALDTVTVMLMMSWAQIGIQRHDVIRPKSALSSEVDKRISCQAGHRKGTDLVILDIEFSLSGQVKEVALIEYVSGRVLLDTLVTPQAPPELSQLKLEWRRGLIEHLWSRKLDSSGTNTDQTLDVCAVAEALEDSGVTKDSVILVWHSTYYDFTLLSNFLESAGANSPLPSRANCVRLVPHVHANVPPHNGKPFPATLSTISPILFLT